jgi:peptide/nickel transport system permease protein
MKVAGIECAGVADAPVAMTRDAWAFLCVGGLCLAGAWQPHDPHNIDLAAAHAGMSWAHPLGTDHLGRDMLAPLMLGAGHTAIVLGIVAAISFVLGTGAGVSAALLGGTTEVVALCVIEFVVMMPALVLALTIAALIGLNPVSAGIALGLSGAGPYAMVAHGLTRRLLAMPFVRAAEALGASTLRIGLTHELPNCLPIMRTYLASDVGRNVVHYSALAFRGLGRCDQSRLGRYAVRVPYFHLRLA